MKDGPMNRETENRRIVSIFAMASFLNDFGSDIIYPVWPLFVTSFPGVDMVILGFIDGLGDAIVSISQAISGYLSDKFGKRKVFIWSGYVFGSWAPFFFSLSLSIVSLILLVFVKEGKR